MFRRWRLRRIHEAFLRACRSVDGASWTDGGFLGRALLGAILPVPPSSLLPGGRELADALSWLEAQSPTVVLGESVIVDYHRRLGQGFDGRYRRGEMTIVGSRLRPIPASRIPSAMRALDSRLRERQAAWDAGRPSEDKILLGAARLYNDLGVIHPFSDGNGRTARLAVNHLVRRYMRAYVILPPLDRDASLLASLEEANEGNVEALSAKLRTGLRRI